MRGSRSTVGTMSELLDHLKLLWAKVGDPRLPGLRPRRSRRRAPRRPRPTLAAPRRAARGAILGFELAARGRAVARRRRPRTCALAGFDARPARTGASRTSRPGGANLPTEGRGLRRRRPRRGRADVARAARRLVRDGLPGRAPDAPWSTSWPDAAGEPERSASPRACTAPGATATSARRRRTSSRSTARSAPARPATASGASPASTGTSSCPIRRGRSAGAPSSRSRRPPSGATSAAWSSTATRRASRSTCRGGISTRPIGAASSHGRRRVEGRRGVLPAARAQDLQGPRPRAARPLPRLPAVSGLRRRPPGGRRAAPGGWGGAPCPRSWPSTWRPRSPSSQRWQRPAGAEEVVELLLAEIRTRLDVPRATSASAT